jgi:hypothetical protein
MEKIFNQKNFNYFVCTPLGSRINIYINFCLQVHFKVSAAGYCCHYLPPVSKVAAGVIDTGGNLPPALLTPVSNLPPVSLTPVANLPPVSTTLAKMVGKFATGVVNTGGNVLSVLLIPVAILPPVLVANLPLVSLIPVVHPEFSKKFETVLMEYSGAGGKLIHEKNKKQKIL